MFSFPVHVSMLVENNVASLQRDNGAFACFLLSASVTVCCAGRWFGAPAIRLPSGPSECNMLFSPFLKTSFALNCEQLFSQQRLSNATVRARFVYAQLTLAVDSRTVDVKNCEDKCS